jgi:hypothetical protein
MGMKRFEPRAPRVALVLAALAMSALSIAATIVLPATIDSQDANSAPAECIQARAVTDQPTD